MGDRGASAGTALEGRSPQAPYLLWHRVREVARSTPDAPAVSDGRVEVTYRELLAGADAVTSWLQGAGVGPGHRVGILATKSVRCVSTLLGVLQAGACYVPVDPRSPPERGRYILENARVRALVSETPVRSRVMGELLEGSSGPVATLLLDDSASREEARPEGAARWSDLPRADRFRPAAGTEHDPAYILYTSGSTGRPKGVVISHRNALTFVDWARETFALTADDRLSNHAPFHFDLSVLDVYGALSSGASVHLVPDRVAPFPAALAQWIEEAGITVWYSVPSALVRLLLHGDLARFSFPHLRSVLFAGEVFPVKHLRQVMDCFSASEFHNLYGPTETNVCTHYAVPRPLPDAVGDLPIGAACTNMEAFALTDEGALGHVDAEGELLVRGPCVMLGYWGMPERTAESIVQNPLHADYLDPVYRTGDRVRVLGDGGFQFLGRRDHMVKVRGYRVELGEIELALHQHAGVREAAVVAIEDDEVGARLKAAVVPDDGDAPEVSAILKHCFERLPKHAVPEAIVFVDALPRTSTGKTDRLALKDHPAFQS